MVVLGQVPPPIHGQALMIERLVQSTFDQVEIHHVPMRFSRTMGQVGDFGVGKVMHVAELVAKVLALQARLRSPLLYYPPAGPHRVPMYRDFALLGALRPLFDKVVFHFHAGGLSGMQPHLSAWERPLFRRAYGNVDGAILLSEHNPPDGERLGAKKSFVVPYGIEDCFQGRAKADGTFTVLFVGAVIPSKGVSTLLDVARLLTKERKRECRFQLMGAFQDESYRQEVSEYLETHSLNDHVELLGTRSGADKWKVFAEASTLCFPTYYEAETFGIVAAEAMQFELPVVASRWRGLPSIVADGESGYLIEPKDVVGFADALEQLMDAPEMARRMGRRGREIYLKEFSLDRWRQRMEEVFLEVLSSEPAAI